MIFLNIFNKFFMQPNNPPPVNPTTPINPAPPINVAKPPKVVRPNNILEPKAPGTNQSNNDPLTKWAQTTLGLVSGNGNGNGNGNSRG
jgi:hypothetical protein